MSYREALLQERDLLLDLCADAVDFEPLVNRLLEERGLFKGGGAATKELKSIELVVLVASENCELLDQTLRLWGLQSYPLARCAVVCLYPSLEASVKKTVEALGNIAHVRVLESSEFDVRAFAEAAYVLFARAGDRLHPGLATALSALDQTQNPDVVVWNEGRLDLVGNVRRRITSILQRPRLERHSLRHHAYIGRAFAVQPKWLVAFPYDLLEAISQTDGHTFQLWLAEQTSAVWHTHPEALTCVLSELDPGRLRSGGSAHVYRDLLGHEGGLFEFCAQATSAMSYRLVPRRRAKSISVVIPFRDKPGETCRCLHSVFRQAISGRLEVILVDNLSTPESLASIRAFIDGYRPKADVRIVSYPFPFNHSRQTMIGVENSAGEVLVFLNNDAELVGAGVLEEMAAWALVPGIGTVGCRITTPDGRLICAGIQSAIRWTPDGGEVSYQESEEPVYAQIIRETVGNTFACAALSRETLSTTGPLDALRFPNGYNDVEFCLRAREKGYHHIYLGHLEVHHVPGSTRSRSDESQKRLLIQTFYPHGVSDHLFQLARKIHQPTSVQVGGVGRGIQNSGLVRWIYQRPWLTRPMRIAYRAGRSVAEVALLGTGVLSPRRRPKELTMKMEEVRVCPGCGAAGSKFWRRGWDQVLGLVPDRFLYVRCTRCRLIYLSNRPSREELDRLYPDHYAPYNPIRARGLLESSELRLRQAPQSDRSVGYGGGRGLSGFLDRFYTPPAAGARLLDFGCGSEFFLDAARQRGWQTIGMDFSERVVLRVRDAGHEAHLASHDGWSKIPDGSLDAVRANHVLEHLDDPRGFLNRVRQKLKRDGAIHIAVPNPESVSSALFRSYWRGLECPRHVVLYSPLVLRQLLRSSGFCDLEVFHERMTKDCIRSLGYMLHGAGLLDRDAAEQLMSRSLLRIFFAPAMWLAQVVGMSDRFHVLARKVNLRSS